MSRLFQKSTESYAGIESVAEDGAILSDFFIGPIFIVQIAPVVFHTEEDARVCPICDPFEGAEYSFDDPDKPLDPLHPNCRCCYTCLKDDPIQGMEIIDLGSKADRQYLANQLGL